MKRLIRLGFCLSLFSAFAVAGSWNGTLIDAMCKGKNPASHTKQCALNCAKSGFGLVLQDGKFLKFDDAGNAKALAALKTTSKEKDLSAKVSGQLEGDTIRVESIEIQ